MKDLYAQLKSEWVSVWERIRLTPIDQLGSQEKEIEAKMEQIGRLAEKIGGQTEKDVKKLRIDVSQFLQGKMSLSELNRMVEHSLKVEQDTREL